MFLDFCGFPLLEQHLSNDFVGLPSVKWVRRGAAMMDAVLDLAYTTTYLIITLLAIYELQVGQAISGNFGDEASVNFQENWTQHSRSHRTFWVSLLSTIHLHMFAPFVGPWSALID
jgi:hypothetical protein